MDNEKKDLVVIPLEWHVPKDLACQYATNLVVQHTDHEFILSFFQTSPPLLLGSHEEVMREAEQVKSVRAHCVGRIIVAASRMEEFVQVQLQNLERFHQARSEEEQED